MRKTAVSIIALTAFTVLAPAPAFAGDPADSYARVQDDKDQRITDLERKVIGLQDQIIALQSRLLSAPPPVAAAPDERGEETVPQLKARIAALESEVQLLRYQRAEAIARAEARAPRRGTAEEALRDLTYRVEASRSSVSPDAPAVVKASVNQAPIASDDFPTGRLRRVGKMSYITVGDGPGALKVSAPNVRGGMVQLDGKELGYAPLVIEGVSPGVHRVEITVDGTPQRKQVLRVKKERAVKRLVMY